MAYKYYFVANSSLFMRLYRAFVANSTKNENKQDLKQLIYSFLKMSNVALPVTLFLLIFLRFAFQNGSLRSDKFTISMT